MVRFHIQQFPSCVYQIQWAEINVVSHTWRRKINCASLTKLNREVSGREFSPIRGYCFVFGMLGICIRSWLPTVLTWDSGKRSSGLKRLNPCMRGELQRKHWMLYGVKTAIKPQRSSQLFFSEIRGQSWNYIILPRSLEQDSFQL